MPTLRFIADSTNDRETCTVTLRDPAGKSVALALTADDMQHRLGAGRDRRRRRVAETAARRDGDRRAASLSPYRLRDKTLGFLQRGLGRREVLALWAIMKPLPVNVIGSLPIVLHWQGPSSRPSPLE